MMKTLDPNIDPLGQAVSAYYYRAVSDPIIVSSDITEEETIPVEHLFGSINELPKLEQLALENCYGKILDVGAAAGRHTIILQEHGFDVTAIEISGLCCMVMEQRGVKNVVTGDYFQYKGAQYDTLLFLMNGIGIAGTVEGLHTLLSKANELLTPNGQVLFDSSDIDYMFYEEDGSKWVDINRPYYGEVNYEMYYKNYIGKEFPWLFIDFDTLAPIAKMHGFQPQLLAHGEHYDYLGVLKKIS